MRGREAGRKRRNSIERDRDQQMTTERTKKKRDEGIELMDVEVRPIVEPDNNIDETLLAPPEHGLADRFPNVAAVVRRQSFPLSQRSENEKRETDQRKFYQALHFLQMLSNHGNRFHELKSFLRGFFVKNAPVSFNTIAAEDEGAFPWYSRLLDRDRTSGEEHLLGTFGIFDYHRTTGADAHPWKDYLSQKLAERAIAQGAENFNNSATTYSSYEVTADGKQLIHTFLEGHPFENRFLLAANSGDPRPAVYSEEIAGVGRLTIWQNGDDGLGAYSAANQGGMLPNLVQTFQILEQIEVTEARTIVDSDRNPERQFTEKETNYIYEQARFLGTEKKYKKRLLEERRKMVQVLGEELNKHLNYECKVILSKDSDKQYPSVVIEFFDSTNGIEIYLNKVAANLRQASINVLKNGEKEGIGISIANRSSFGFAAPTVSELEKSIRVWPGLIPAEAFAKIMTEALAPYIEDPATPETVFHAVVAKINNEASPLELALRQSIRRAIVRFDTAPSLSLPEELKELHEWIKHRVTSNLTKANRLLELLKSGKHTDGSVIQRAIRTLENLNEYEILQAGLEESSIPVESMTARKQTLLRAFKERTAARFQARDTPWELQSVKLTASGMAAYRTVTALTGEVRVKSNRSYFEISKLSNKLAESEFVKGYEDERFDKKAMVVKMKDLAYNYTHRKQLKQSVKSEWDGTDGLPRIAIYDTTNTTAKEAMDDAEKDTSIDYVVMFESLSKHFQFGADKTTLGKIIVLKKKRPRTTIASETLTAMDARFNAMQDTPLPNGFLNYILMQDQAFDLPEGEEMLSAPFSDNLAIATAVAAASSGDGNLPTSFSPSSVLSSLN